MSALTDSLSDLKRWREISIAIARFGKRHRSVLLLGLSMSVIIVAVRVALPWLFKWMIHNWLEADQLVIPLWIETIGPGLTIGMAFLILVSLHGYADYSARLNFARFAIGTLRDIRAAVFTALKLSPGETLPTHEGDLISRLIGDVARMKTGLKGFLIHVATNGLLLLVVSIVLMIVDATLGIFFFAAFLIVLVITFFTASSLYRRALRYRIKEGDLATAIYDYFEPTPTSGSIPAINESSGRHEAALSKTQGLATWTTHIIYGLAVMATVIIGMNRVSTGDLATSDLVIFLLYALIVRAPLVKINRQGSRTGKIFACADRLVQIMESKPEDSGEIANPAWRQIELCSIKTKSTKARGKRKRLGAIDLTVNRGQKILVTGKSGSGKSSLLSALANQLRVNSGARFLDGVDYEQLDAGSFNDLVMFVEHDYQWPKKPVAQLLNLDSERLQANTELIESIGLNRLLQELPKGAETKLGSEHLSPSERRLMAIASAALGDRSLILLDDIFADFSKQEAYIRLNALIKARPDATIVVSIRKPVAVELFDHVIQLKNGKIQSVSPQTDQVRNTQAAKQKSD